MVATVAVLSEVDPVVDHSRYLLRADFGAVG